MVNEVLCKFLCHNICVVHQSHIELGLEPVFRLGENDPGEGPVPPRRAVGQEGPVTAPVEQTSQGDEPVILPFPGYGGLK